MKRLPWFPIGGLVIVILATLAVLGIVRAQERANGWVAHTIRVEARVTQILERTRAVESSHRGFLILNDRSFLGEMNGAIDDLWRDVALLRRETADNPPQQRNLESLVRILRAKILFARRSTDLMLQGQTDQALAMVATRRGQALMEGVRATADRMLSEEQRLFTLRTAQSRELVRWLTFWLAASVLIVVLVAFLTVSDARRRLAAVDASRAEADRAAVALREQMKAREDAEAQLRQAQKMESIGQLTGGIAHDFNNMLAVVIGCLDLAKRRIGDAASLEKYIDHAREGAERAASLTARLLAFSRQQPLAPLPTDCNRLVSGMSELLRRTLGEHVAVETVLAGGLWPTFVDKAQLENAVLNLAVNARDAMPEGGKLTIETANAHLDDDYSRLRSDVTPGQYVLICVSDTGTGMKPEVIERVFDPFFTTKDVGKGTGLGLSQVFGFVKQSGGHVAVYSELGEGTTVKLYLPRHRGAAIEAERPLPTSDMPMGDAGEIILVVEDEQRVRHFSIDALRQLGYTTISAGSGREALELLAAQPQVSLLFTDIVMPEMNGRRLADTAREMIPDLKILYTTGYTRNAVVHNGMLDPGVAFLPKPFSVAQLAWKVREVLDGDGANRPG